jgi:small subunit ribosomal protein S4
LVRHGHIRVNGEEVIIPSYLVKPAEEILMEESALQLPDVQEVTEASPHVPSWLEKRDGGVILREPTRDEIDPDIQEQWIVEFYSR